MTGLGRLKEAVAAAWPFRPRPERDAAEALLRTMVAASRAFALYGPEKLPDEMEPRFESAVVHASLALIRLKREPEAAPVGQEFVDLLFRWLDSGLYEAGVGYQKVPKEMRSLAARFYGRLEAYAASVETADEAALSAALARNVMRTAPESWPFAQIWSAHILRVAQLQAAAPWRQLALESSWPPLS